MTYIVTTCIGRLDEYRLVGWATRQAVATLDEARDAVYAQLRELYPNGSRETGATEAALYANGLRESGGTVGPLPDGTTIVVRARV